MADERACRWCQQPITNRLVMGRKRLYCSGTCRWQYGYHHREDISEAEIERRFQAAKAAIKWARVRGDGQGLLGNTGRIHTQGKSPVATTRQRGGLLQRERSEDGRMVAGTDRGGADC